jgi:hypothetical protein
MRLLAENLRYKQVSSLAHGELVVRSSASGTYTAIVALIEPGAMSEFVLKKASDDDFEPYWVIKTDRNGGCLSYGLDWVLELLDDPRAVPENSGIWESLGVIKDDGTRLEIRLLFKGAGLARRIDISTLTEIETPDLIGIGYPRWRIWGSIGAKDRGDRPIVEFNLAS